MSIVNSVTVMLLCVLPLTSCIPPSMPWNFLYDMSVAGSLSPLFGFKRSLTICLISQYWPVTLLPMLCCTFTLNCCPLVLFLRAELYILLIHLLIHLQNWTFYISAYSSAELNILYIWLCDSPGLLHGTLHCLLP